MNLEFWNIARADAEIIRSMNCEVQSDMPGLIAYYKFNQGVGRANNTAEINATDSTLNANNGILEHFSLSGTISNWLSGSPIISDVLVPTVPIATQYFNYNLGDSVTPLEAITSADGLLWYTTETDGVGSTTSPTPDSSTIGYTSYWVTSTNVNGCESERIEIVVQVNSDIEATHLNFDGIDDFVICGDAMEYSYTKEAWIYVSDLSLNNNIISGANGAHIFYVPSGAGSKLSSGHNSDWTAVQDSNALLVNTWYHVAVTYDEATTTMKLYKNGVLVDENNNVPRHNGGTTAYLGRGNVVNDRFKGNIDEVRIWSYARLEQDISANKDCELQGTEPGLKAYYQFNQVLDASNNTGFSRITNLGAYTYEPVMLGFTRNGATSNWLAGSPISTIALPSTNTSVIYCQNDLALPLVATTPETGLSWYANASGGNALASAPTPDTSIAGSTSYWVASESQDGCESTRVEIVITILDAANCKAVVSPKIYLQGAMLNPNTGEENLMRDDLRIANLIPTTSPYADNATCDVSVFTITGSEVIVDWVWLELRDKNDNTIVVASQSALLQRYGDVVSVDGISPVEFLIKPDSFYVMVNHRNHLGIITALSMPLNHIATPVNYTDLNLPITFGINAQANIGSNIFGLWAGNVAGNATIRYQGSGNDTNTIKDIVINDSGNTSNSNLYQFTGYSNADVNLDGNIRYQGSGNDSNTIKDIIINHPGNSSNSNLFQFTEQLPEH